VVAVPADRIRVSVDSTVWNGHEIHVHLPADAA